MTAPFETMYVSEARADPLRADVWGLRRELTSDERERIRELAADGDGLNLYYVQHVCMDALSKDRLFEPELLTRSSARTLYNRQVCTRVPSERAVLEGISAAARYMPHTPLWIVTAAARLRGADLSPDEVTASLSRLQEDGLVVREGPAHQGPTPTWLGHCGSWRLAHDVLHSAILHCIRDVDTTLEGLTTEATRLAATAQMRTVDALAEAFQSWTALAVCGPERPPEDAVNLAPLLRALLARVTHLVDEFDRKDVINCIVGATHRVADDPVSRAEVSSRRYADVRQLAAGIQEMVAPELLRPICHKEVSILGMGHRMAKIGYASGLLQVHPLMEVVEADVPELAAIAQRCLPKTEISDPPRDWDFTPQVRLCELLCWARRWYEAGLVMEAAIACASAGSLNRKALVLSRAHLAAGAYLQGGHMADAERVYHVAADMAASETMLRHLRTEFQHLAHIIANAPEHIDDLPHLLSEAHASTQDHASTTASRRVHILASYENHGAAALVASALATQGLYAILVYAHSVLDWSGLPPACGNVIMGTAYAYEVRRLMMDVVPPSLHAEVAITQMVPPRYAVAEFSVSGAEGLWIAASYPWQLVDAAIHWVEHGGADRFSHRIFGRPQGDTATS